MDFVDGPALENYNSRWRRPSACFLHSRRL